MNANEHVNAIKRIASTFREGGFLSPADEMCRHTDALAERLNEVEARIANLLGANEALELRIDELVADKEVARSLAYWQRIADYHFAKRQAAEARAERWKACALAWERYDDSFWLGVDDEETDRAKELLDATYGQLREFGDLPTDGDHALVTTEGGDKK